jgi:hypothetical protein
MLGERWDERALYMQNRRKKSMITGGIVAVET